MSSLPSNAPFQWFQTPLGVSLKDSVFHLLPPFFFFSFLIIHLLYLGRCLSVFLWAIEINSMAYHIFHRILLFLFSERHLWTIWSVVHSPFQAPLQSITATYRFAFLGLCNRYSISEKISTNIFLRSKNRNLHMCKILQKTNGKKVPVPLILRSYGCRAFSNMLVQPHFRFQKPTFLVFSLEFL